MNYQFSPDAVILIAKFEGFRGNPYLDSVKVPTIGYGSTTYPDGRKVTMKDAPIDKDIAGAMLLYHLNKIELPDLNKCIIRGDLKQNQIDAIGSLMYNIGDSGFCGSTLHKLINSSAPIDQIKIHWLEWDKAGGKVIQGLLTRRTAEFNFYNK